MESSKTKKVKKKKKEVSDANLLKMPPMETEESSKEKEALYKNIIPNHTKTDEELIEAFNNHLIIIKIKLIQNIYLILQIVYFFRNIK